MFIKLVSSKISQIVPCQGMWRFSPLSHGLADNRSIFVLAWHIFVAGQPDSAIFAPCGKTYRSGDFPSILRAKSDQLFRVMQSFDNTFLEDQP
jgi:hypothetical protein